MDCLGFRKSRGGFLTKGGKLPSIRGVRLENFFFVGVHDFNFSHNLVMES